MGQAKLRGSFEERKRQAIEVGRVKTKKLNSNKVVKEITAEIVNMMFPIMSEDSKIVLWRYGNEQNLLQSRLHRK